MGCLSVGIQKAGGLSISATNLNDCEVGYSKVSGCEVGYSQISGMSIDSKMIGGLEVKVLFVCHVGTREFIKVSPEEPLWIDVGFDGTFTIRSNTAWRIK